jgi:predicted flavoprotein YhiN
VMHDPSKGNTEVARGYPRGQRELLSPFNSQFGPGDTYEWFRSRGVELKTERDGRVFPVTDQSSTIIEALQTAARQMRVKVLCSSSVTAVDYDNNTCEFTAVYSQSTSHDDANNKNGGVMKNRQSVKVTADSVILATGSSR